MNYFPAVVPLLLIAACSHAPSPAVSKLEPGEGMNQTQLDSIVSLMEYLPDGIQFSLAFIRDSSSHTYGYIRKRDSLFHTNNGDSVFETGSLSKVFTAHLLCQYASSGSLGLEDAISDHLDIEPSTDTPITLMQLANHTSGLPRIPPDMMWSSIFHRDNPYREYDEERLRTYLKEKMEVQARPGTKYKYSNLGYGILGYLLTKQSGTSYEELLREGIFDPLEMHRTSADRSKIEPYLVEGLDENGEQTANWDLAALEGAGAVLSSVNDLSTYAQSILHRPDTAIRLQLKETYKLDPRRGVALGWHTLNLPAPTRDTSSVPALNEMPRKRIYWHNGGTGGYRCCMAFSVSDDQAVILLTNLSAGHPRAKRVDQLVFDLLEQLGD